jgi:antirestriction protein ArdC
MLTPTKIKSSVLEIVTERLLDVMAQGTCPWDKPWDGGLALPTSFATGKAYRGINRLILNAVQMADGYPHPLWITPSQLGKMDQHIKKDEHYTPVVLWKPEKKIDAAGVEQQYMLMRFFKVWNVAQTTITEIPEKFLVKRPPVTMIDGLEKAIHYAGGPTVKHLRQDAAYYRPSTDEIVLPMLDQFHTSTGLTGTALHEITHSTGHESRLKRITDTSVFGSDPYAKEELVAEIGSALIATMLGMDVDWNRSASYLKSWLSVLKSDQKLLISAAQAAQKAADLVVGEPAFTE